MLQNSLPATHSDVQVASVGKSNRPCIVLENSMGMALKCHLQLLCVLVKIFLVNSEFIFQGFKGITSANITLDGASIITPNGALQLTNSSQRISGHAFYSSPLHMFKDDSPSSFSTNFVFEIVPESLEKGGGHGLVFVIAPSRKLHGVISGPSLGVMGPKNSGNTSNHLFMVEFNTVKGSDSYGTVGIDVNSLTSINSEQASYYIDNTGQKSPLKLESGNPIQAWIEYDGALMVVNVTIAPLQVPKPEQPLISTSLNLSDVLKRVMYVGFSSATGKLSSSHYILGWSFRMDGASQPLDPSQLPYPQHPRKGSREETGIKIGAASSVTTIFLVAALAGGLLYYHHKGKQRDVLEDWEVDFAHRFRYKELYSATKGFKGSEVLGFGGFGCVYKGTLPNTKEAVAIKKISHNSRQGIREFVAEIESLGRMRHKHLVHLHGWCKHNDDLLLVYDFMPNGSLDSLIFSNSKVNTFLTWTQRFRILKGIASALLYLHEEWEQVVIHRDVKSNNVLLDANMEARLGDFGLSRLYDHGKNPSTTHIVGTLGYIAPELSQTGKATTHCDVYSYGALLLEVACGKRPIDISGSSGHIILLDWVRECWDKGYVCEAADPGLAGEYASEEMELVLTLGLLCCQRRPEGRPSMRQITRYLDGSELLPQVVSLGFEYFHGDPRLQLVSSSEVSSLGLGVISSGSFRGGR